MRLYPHFILPMRRSRGFASARPDSVALFRLGFPLATVRHTLTRRGMQVAGSLYKRHAIRQRSHRPLTACKHVVSGSPTSPHRGSSHLSLALLRALSVVREYLALRDGPRRFRLASTDRVLLRIRPHPALPSYGTFTPSGVAFLPLRLVGLGLLAVLQPQGVAPLVWAVPRSLAATDGVEVSFSSWG
jgi:hypothetical protein